MWESEWYLSGVCLVWNVEKKPILGRLIPERRIMYEQGEMDLLTCHAVARIRRSSDGELHTVVSDGQVSIPSSIGRRGRERVEQGQMGDLRMKLNEQTVNLKVWRPLTPSPIHRKEELSSG